MDENNSTSGRKPRASTGRRRAGHLSGVANVVGSDDMDTQKFGAHNMTFARIVDQVTDAGLTQKELGEVVGASLRTVQNWAAGGSSPRGMSQQRLLELKYIVEELSVVYTDEAIEIWFRARNRNLGGRSPIDLMADGRIDEVRREAERVSGAM
jgi:transcriptional regulator with XRE-family HTH domain